MTTSAVSLISAAPRLIAAVHARLPVDEVPRRFMASLDQVYAARAAGAVQLDGVNIFLYRDVAGQPGVVDAWFGVGTRAAFERHGAVEPVALPTGTAARAVHQGPYSGLRAAHGAVIDWCRATGRQRTGVRWEIYGHWTADESQLVTEVVHQVATEG